MTSLVSGLANAGLGLGTSLLGHYSKVRFATDSGETIAEFDATINESYDFSSDPTSFPVESGLSISDHVIRKPTSLALTAIVTDTPINNVKSYAQTAATSAAVAALPPLGVISAAVAYAAVNARTNPISPSIDAYYKLVSLQRGDALTPPEPFTVYTRIGVFPDMVITSLSIPRDSSTGAAMTFTIKLAKLIVVAPQTIKVSKLDQPGLASAKRHLGEQQKALHDVDAIRRTYDVGVIDGSTLKVPGT